MISNLFNLFFQEQLARRDEENAREKKNILEQLEKQRKDYEEQKLSTDKKTLEVIILDICPKTIHLKSRFFLFNSHLYTNK